jgi:hypothetical protein
MYTTQRETISLKMAFSHNKSQFDIDFERYKYIYIDNRPVQQIDSVYSDIPANSYT